MTTTVKHKGKEREWSGPIENWEAHSEVIKHWCDGGDVLNECVGGWNLHTGTPNFEANQPYKIKIRGPKPGEVWIHKQYGECLYRHPIDGMEHEFPFVRLCNGDGVKGYLEFGYDSVESYYAKKFIDECQTMDSGWPYDDCMKLLRNLKAKIEF